jgi:hypothetical protein
MLYAWDRLTAQLQLKNSLVATAADLMLATAANARRKTLINFAKPAQSDYLTIYSYAFLSYTYYYVA